MNSHTRFIYIISFISINWLLQAHVIPYLALRSQGINGARELVGWQTTINRFDVGTIYASLSVTPEYTRSFRPQRITQWLFSDALTLCHGIQHGQHCKFQGIKIQGTKVPNRDPQALMAENFYLPYDYDSIVTFKPVIENELIDINMYIGLDHLYEGLFFRIHSPLCHTSWNLNFREHIKNKGQTAYDVGYMDNTFTTPCTDPDIHGLERHKMLDSFTEYVCKGATLPDHDGITYYGLENARISTGACTKTAFAELTAQLGWNFCTGPGYHCGIAIRAAAPTGNRPNGRLLFEPIVGNGHHWELGGSLTSHWCSWKNFDETLHINTYVDINITHLFSMRQCRTFDLWCNPLSRYMLAVQFKPDVQNLKVYSDTTPPIDYAPAAQGAKVLTPLANITTIPVDVSATVQGELIIKCALSYKNYQCDLGYNFWGRSCLDIYRTCCQNKCIDFAENTYGIKGDSYIFGFPLIMDNDQLIDVQQPGISLSATQHNATIFNGCNNFYTQSWTNLGIDTPKDAYDNTLNNLGTKPNDPDNPTTSPYGWDTVKTSANPILLTFNDLDINQTRTRSLSHKIFAHVNYMWTCKPCLEPYLGFGLEIEFGQKDDHCAQPRTKAQPTSCTTPLSSCCAKDNQCSSESDCRTVALSQWGVWIKGGISFN